MPFYCTVLGWVMYTVIQVRVWLHGIFLGGCHEVTRCTVEPQKLASPVISKLVLHFPEMLSILALHFPQRCLIQQCVHTCLVCLSPIADPDHLSDLMSDTASAVHHADLPMSATLGPRRPVVRFHCSDFPFRCGHPWHPNGWC